MGRSPLDDLSNTVKDAVYVSLGLGVMAFQRLQVKRNELTKALSRPADEVRGTLEAVGSLVGERVKMLEERLTGGRGR